MISPDDLNGLKPGLVGSIGGGMSFLYSCAENERAFSWALLGLFLAFGSVGAYAIDALVLPDDFKPRAVCWWLAGSVMYPGYGAIRTRALEYVQKWKRT